MFPKAELLGETKGGGKEGKKDRKWIIMCVGIRHNETHWKLLNNTGWGKRVRKTSEGRLDWLKHVIFTGKRLRQNSHWTMNRHLNNEGQEHKTGCVKGRSLVGKRK
jgi:hypothetical protein